MVKQIAEADVDALELVDEAARLLPDSAGRQRIRYKREAGLIPVGKLEEKP